MVGYYHNGGQLQHGLVRGSFIPDRPQRELRDLTRYRKSLIRDRASAVNRLQEVLEDANIKLASVATDIMGVSARSMLQAIAGGEQDSDVLSSMARGRLREKRPELGRALAGRVTDHHRFMLAEQLAHLEVLDEAIERMDTEIESRMHPFQEELDFLDSIPGMGQRTAQALLAEVGLALERFPTSGRLASWAGLCPGNNESAGKRLSGKARKGSPWLKEAMVEAARAAARTKTYLGAMYHRLAARRGAKRAALAVAHTIVVIAYHLLTRRQPYQDLGADYFDERDRYAVQRCLIRRLERVGLEVSVQTVPLPT